MYENINNNNNNNSYNNNNNSKTTLATNNTKKANQQGLFETFAYDYIWSGACNPMRLGLRKQSG